MEKNRKVLLRISNLKQYFPLKQRGMFVKANDGISIDIYEGEVFGLVGESGCGKSTLGRTLLQLYKQTDGRTMYYGRSLLDVAPVYIKKTLKSLKKCKTRYKILESKKDNIVKLYQSQDEKSKYAMHAEYDRAIKEANDAYLDIVEIIGGFILADNLKPVTEAFMAVYNASVERKKLDIRREFLRLDYDDTEYKLSKRKKTGGNTAGFEKKLAGIKKKLDLVDGELEKVNGKIAAAEAAIDKMRKAYAGNEEFWKIEALRDDGVDLARLTYDEMRRLRCDMQLIFQDPYSSLNPRMTVGQIIGEGMLAHNYFKRNDGRMQEEILRVMDSCGLQPYFIHRYPHQFSGGQRQRIGIARSLAVRPKFIVCDEAVSALDVSIQSQIINLLQDLKEQRNLTYLFITHDLSVVKYISDRIGVMYLGNMVELASSEDIFRSPLHPYTEALLAAIPTTDYGTKKDLEILEGDIPSPVNPPSGCKFHARCRYCTEICEHVPPEWVEARPNHFVACHHILEVKEDKNQN